MEPASTSDTTADQRVQYHKVLNDSLGALKNSNQRNVLTRLRDEIIAARVGLIGLESTLDATAVNRIQDQLMGLSGLRGDVIRRDIGISTRSLEQQTASALNKLIKSDQFRNGLHLIEKERFCAAIESSCIAPMFRAGKVTAPNLIKVRGTLDHLKYQARFHQAINEVQNSRHVQAKLMLEEYHSGLQAAAEREIYQLENGREMQLLLEDYQLYIALCTGYQHIGNGDRLLERALKSEDGEVVDFAYAAFLALDEYRYAYLSVAEKDLEAEGLVVCKIGQFYGNVINNETRANEYYLRAVHMAGSMQPIIPRGAWYNDCKEAIERRRNQTIRKEEGEWENRRKPVIEALVCELGQLEKAAGSMDNRTFVQFLYEDAVFAPKEPGEGDIPAASSYDDENSLDRTVSKAAFLRIIMRYHPDKNMKWRPAADAPLDANDPNAQYSVLCEEITKYLNRKYGEAYGC